MLLSAAIGKRPSCWPAGVMSSWPHMNHLSRPAVKSIHSQKHRLLIEKEPIQARNISRKSISITIFNQVCSVSHALRESHCGMCDPMSDAYRDGTYANILGGQLFIPSHLGKMAQDFIYKVWAILYTMTMPASHNSAYLCI